ncbi:MAG: hypothetical protein WC916_04760 [Candidatus Woesearchaeota archaeon]
MSDNTLESKTCDLCKITSQDTAVFSCHYAKGELHICLGCLTEGVIDIYKDSMKFAKQSPQTPELALQEFSMPTEVYGFTCQNCGSVLFADTFPVMCDCGHISQEEILQKQQQMKK